jgi:ribosomal protein L11 methylase PrmA
MKLVADAGSFRDPSGRVYLGNGTIYRTVAAAAAGQFAFVRDSGLLELLESSGRVVTTEEIDAKLLSGLGPETSQVLRHSQIPFISYPYEWPFLLLKRAALLHLDIQIEALQRGVTLSDASAYNVQFIGPNPIFIDILSFIRYREGELWKGHRQFCEQFLNPLLLRTFFGVPHNSWYRGTLEGVEAQQLCDLLPWWRKLSFRTLAHVVLPARLNRLAAHNTGSLAERARKATLPRGSYLAMLHQLRTWISHLAPKKSPETTWQNYANFHSYHGEQHEAKRRFVARFCASLRPQLLLDFGCNTGEYSDIALSAGARRVVGFDFDQGALDLACKRAVDRSLDFLPLFQDGANPSPAQGWNMAERRDLGTRARADALIALALEHHLTIGRNIPLGDVVRWLIALAPRGIIEFVPKADPAIQRMLTLREDIFPDYSQASFEHALAGCAKIVTSETISDTGRVLYEYDRSCNHPPISTQ